MEDLTLIQTGTWIDGLDQDGAPDAGEKILYSFELTNTGTVDLTNVAVTGLGITINPGSFNGNLAAGATVTLTGEYTIRQADIDSAQVAIAATATGQGTVPITVQAQTNPVQLDQFTSLNIIKTPTGFRDANGSGRRDAGDEAIYSYRVINTGNVTLRNVTLGDDNGVPGTNPLIAVPLVGLVDGDADSQADDLRPGGEATGELRTIITQDFLTAGIVENIATAKAQSPQGINELVTTAAQIDVRDPKIDVTKRVETVADTNNNGVRDAGDLVTYAYTVSNIGNVPLLNVKLRDNNGTAALGDDFDVTPLVGLVDADGDGFVDDLAVGAIATGTEVVPLTQAAVNAGSVTNIVNAEGTSPSVTFKGVVRPGRTVRDNANATVPITSTPRITIVKTAGAIVNANGNAITGDAGDTVVYSYVVTNTGNVTLTNVTVRDDNGTAGAANTGDDFSVILGTTTLQPGQSTTGQSLPVALTVAGVDAGSVTNTAVATGQPPRGTPVTAEAKATVTPNNLGKIGLVKTAGAIVDANNNTIIGDAGDTVVYSYNVTNLGAVTLNNLVLRDDNGTPTDPLDDFNVTLGATTLASGASTTGVSTAIPLTQPKVDAGTVINTAKVTGTDPRGNPVGAEANATVTVAPLPKIAVTKTAGAIVNANGNAITGDAGDTVVYSYVVTNTGNVTLTNVTIRDDNGTPGVANTGDDFSVILGTTTLQPGESTTGQSLPVALTVAGVDAGSVTNTAVATGQPPRGTPVTAEAKATVTPNNLGKIGLVKTAGAIVDANNNTIIGDAADTVVYSYNVTNLGAVTLNNLVLRDDNGTPTDPLDDFNVTLGATTLASGASTTGVSTAIPLTQPKVDAGTVINTAKVTATDPKGTPVGAEAKATVTVSLPAAIAVTKTAGAIADTNQNGFIGDAGDTVVYSYSVTNTGSVSLLDVTLKDDNGTLTDATDDFFVTLSGQISNLNGNTIPDLEVGKVATGQSAPIPLTPADIIAGQVTNVAQAQATDPKGNPVNGTATAKVVVPTRSQPPLIGLVKTAGEIQDNDCDGNPSAGDTVVYTYAVSNIGQVDLFNRRSSRGSIVLQNLVR
jgi:uncharacterized repeat protein (TIGR01451 family)